MKKLLFFALFCVLLISCKEKDILFRDVLSDFDVVVELSAPKTIIDNLLNPVHLSVCNSLILFSEKTDSTTTVLYDTSGNHIINFLWKGRGPGETANTLDVSFYNDMIIQASVHPERIFLYDINQLLSGKQMPCGIHSLDAGDYASATILQCDDDVLFYVGKDPKSKINDNRFCIRDIKRNILYSFGRFPEEDIVISEFPEEDYSRQTAYQGRPVLKPDHTKIVVPYYYAVGFDIVNRDERIVECSNFYQYPGVECQYISQIKATAVKRNEEKYRGFLDACCSDESIYFLYSAKKLGDPGNVYGKYVLKYNWKGEPECCYILDREVVNIAIDKNEKYLYVCFHDIEGGSIERYSL